MALALLQWNPWMSALPGCCFVEESCEALLSRMVGRCRANTSLTELEQIVQLFVTLPLPKREPRGTVGGIGRSLVELFSQRLHKIIQDCDSQPFAKVLNAQNAV